MSINALPFANARGGALPQPFTRRQMLQRLCTGFGMVGLAGLLGPESVCGAATGLPHFAPRAKRAVFLFMNGGPSHVDTFDPKPALKRFEGEQPGGICTRKPKELAFCHRPWNLAGGVNAALK